MSVYKTFYRKILKTTLAGIIVPFLLLTVSLSDAVQSSFLSRVPIGVPMKRPVISFGMEAIPPFSFWSRQFGPVPKTFRSVYLAAKILSHGVVSSNGEKYRFLYHPYDYLKVVWAYFRSHTHDAEIFFHLYAASQSIGERWPPSKSIWARLSDDGSSPLTNLVWRNVREAVLNGTIFAQKTTLSTARRCLKTLWPELERLLTDDNLLTFSVTPAISGGEFENIIPILSNINPASGLLLLAVMGAHHRVEMDPADGRHYRSLIATLETEYIEVRDHPEALKLWIQAHYEDLGLFLNGFFQLKLEHSISKYLGDAEDALWRQLLWLALSLYIPEPSSVIPLAYRNHGFSFGNLFYHGLALWNESHRGDLLTAKQALSGDPKGVPFWQQAAEPELDDYVSLRIFGKQVDEKTSRQTADSLHRLARHPSGLRETRQLFTAA